MKRFASVLDYPHPGLDETVWDKSGKLKEPIKEFILQSLSKHLKESNLLASDQWIENIVLIGSLTTYQYTSKSDTDIHIKVNLPAFIKAEKLSFTPEQAHLFLDNVRKLWNEHEVILPGSKHPVEFFFETPLVNPEGLGTGVYSLKTDTWESPPIPVSIDFDIEEMKPFLIDMANVIAEEMDGSFGTIKRHIQRIEELQEVMQAWPEDKRKIFQTKIEEKLVLIEEELEELSKTKEKIVKDRRKNYDKQSPQEVKFKYLQRFGYLWIITSLNDIVNMLEGDTVEVSDLPEIKEVINTPVEKQAEQEEGPRLFIDFDKTIAHSEGDTVNGPIEGVKEAFAKFKEDGWEIHIYSCRANDVEGLDTIQQFLTSNNLPFDEIFIGKPLGFYYIDDRALQFTTWGEIVPKVKKQASLMISAEVSGRLWVDPYGRMYPVTDIHPTWIKENRQKLDKDYGIKFDETTINYGTPVLLEAGWTRITTDFDISEAQFGVEVKDLRHLPRYIDTIMPELYSEQLASLGTPIVFNDLNGNIVSVERPFPAQRNVNRALMSSSKTASYHDTDAYWLDPNGLKFRVRTGRDKNNTHVEWVYNNQSFLNVEYGISFNKSDFGNPDEHIFNYNEINGFMLSKGWVRVDGGSVQVFNLRSIPAFVFDNLPPVRTVTFEDAERDNSVHVDHDEAATGGQKAINRSLALPVHASKEGVKYSSVQVNIPSLVSQDIVAWGVRNIPDEDLFLDEERKSGRELESHITIKYGLLTNEAKDLEKFFKGVSPIEIKLGKTKHFEPPELPFDVVTVEVMSDSLPELNKKICGELECADGLIEEYRPHITVAYVKRGSGKKYIGDDFMEGSELSLEEVVFSPVEGERTTFSLGEKKEASFMPSIVQAPDNPWQSDSDVEIPVDPDSTNEEQTYNNPIVDKPRKSLWQKFLDFFRNKKDVEKEALSPPVPPQTNKQQIKPMGLTEIFYFQSVAPQDVQDEVDILLDSGHTAEAWVIMEKYIGRRHLNPKSSLVKIAEDEGYWIDPNGKTYTVRDDSTEYQTHNDWIIRNRKLLETEYHIDPEEINALEGTGKELNNMLIGKGWVRIGDSGSGDIGIRVPDLRRIPRKVEEVLMTIYNGGTISLEDLNGKRTYVDKLDEDLQKAVNLGLRVYASIQFCKNCGTTHDLARTCDNTTWDDTRQDLEPFKPLPTTFQQTTNDENLGQPGVRRFMGRPQGVEYSNDEKIIDFLVEEEHNKKKASPLSDILKLVQETGGATYNLSKGNLSGTQTFAVATHPDRATILDHMPSEQELSQYVAKNEDLLNDETSLGVWSSDGKVYLDIVSTLSDRDAAIELGKKNNQIAIFDLHTLQEIPTGGTGEVPKNASSNIIEMDPYGGGKGFPVYVNPSRNQVIALIRKYPEGLRVIDGLNAMYIWEAHIATHDHVLSNLVENGYEEYSGVQTGYVTDPSDVDDFTWKRAFLKKASLPSRFWIDPNGVRYDAGTHHGAWIKVNKDLLAKKYNIKYNGLGGVTWTEMMSKGWVRVSNEPAGTGFHIQVLDMTRIPKFVDDLIAEYYDRGGVIGLGDQQGRHVEISNPFPSLQKVVNRALQKGDLKGNLVAKVAKVENIDGVRVYINPSQEELHRISKTFHQEFMNLPSVRALIDSKTGDIYAWDGWFQEHNTMSKSLGLANAYHWDGGTDELAHLYALQEDMRHSKITAGNLSTTYTDQQMEQIYQEQHEYGDSSGGGNVYHDFSNSSTDYPKEPGPYKIRLDLLNNPDDRQFPLNLPSYEVTWFTGMPQG